jgi:imidazolonepropionase-like amidohydrolase
MTDFLLAKQVLVAPSGAGRGAKDTSAARSAHPGGRVILARAMSSNLVVTVFALVACLGAMPVHAAEPRALALENVAIVDVEQGRVSAPQTVVVSNGRIAAIGAHAAIPDGAMHLDGHGRFLIPGLVDAHVHLFNNASKRPPNTWTFPLYVANGVTGVREMAAVPDGIATVNAWRASIADGTLVAPRILAAGVVVDGSTPAEAAQRVDAAADAHADFGKLFSGVSVANWHAILDEARERSLPVAGHVPAGISALVAAKAGQRTAEHLMQVFEACTPIESEIIDARRDLAGDALVERMEDDEPRVLAAFDARTCERVARELAKTHQVQVPTLVLPWVESQPVHDASSDPRWKYLRPDERTRWQRIAAQLTPEQRTVAARRWDVARRIVLALDRANVPIVAGTDAPMPNVYPGFALHDELERLVDAGLTPAEALRAATLAPAKLFGIEHDAGTIAIGKRADLVLLDADPLRDIRNTRRIDAVVLDGRFFDRAALDALLARAAADAK